MDRVAKIEIATADGSPINDLVDYLSEHHRAFLDDLGAVQLVEGQGRLGGEGRSQFVALNITPVQIDKLTSETRESLQNLIASFYADGEQVEQSVEGDVLQITIKAS